MYIYVYIYIYVIHVLMFMYVCMYMSACMRIFMDILIQEMIHTHTHTHKYSPSTSLGSHADKKFTLDQSCDLKRFINISIIINNKIKKETTRACTCIPILGMRRSSCRQIHVCSLKSERMDSQFRRRSNGTIRMCACTHVLLFTYV